jgi:hypothetical protein
MLAPWVLEEMMTANLPDKRLTDRLRLMLSAFGDRPTASIPAACGGHAETEAAYRFFNNERVTFDQILAPHYEATKRRIAAQECVIVAQDTTEVDVTRPQQQVRGAGPLDSGSRRGALLHGLHAFTMDGTPLGSVHADAWTREDGAPAPPRSAPIEDKESVRWVAGVRCVQQLAAELPDTKLVSVSDSEADIFELFVQAESIDRDVQRGADWIVRACQNRAVMPHPENLRETPLLEGEDAPRYIIESVQETQVLFDYEIYIRGREPKVDCEQRGRRNARISRTTRVEVRAACVTLRPPNRKGRKLPPVTVNVVLVRESHPPEGESPIEWVLLTSLPIETLEQVRNVIASYCVRWMIEILFRTLKSGCRIEERRFETLPRVLNCVALYLIVAWRTLYTCRLARSCPDASCEVVFEASEWKSVYFVIHNRMPPSKPPRLREMIRMVAQLGGYINKPREDDPGPQTVWLGLARANDIAHCWRTFGPESKNSLQVV